MHVTGAAAGVAQYVPGEHATCADEPAGQYEPLEQANDAALRPVVLHTDLEAKESGEGR